MKYVVRTTGALLAGFEADDVEMSLQQRMSMSSVQARKLVSGQALSVAATVYRSKAAKLARSLSACGLEIRLVESSDGEAQRLVSAAPAGALTEAEPATIKSEAAALLAADPVHAAPELPAASPPVRRESLLFHPVVPAALAGGFIATISWDWGWAAVALWSGTAVWMLIDALRLEQSRLAHGGALASPLVIFLLGLVPVVGPIGYAAHLLFERCLGLLAGPTQKMHTTGMKAEALARKVGNPSLSQELYFPARAFWLLSVGLATIVVLAMPEGLLVEMLLVIVGYGLFIFFAYSLFCFGAGSGILGIPFVLFGGGSMILYIMMLCFVLYDLIVNSGAS